MIKPREVRGKKKGVKKNKRKGGQEYDSSSDGVYIERYLLYVVWMHEIDEM